MKHTGGKSAWFWWRLNGQELTPLSTLYDFVFFFVTICHYLLLFVSIFFMTNIKAPNMKSTVLVAPRRARVLLWMILYFHLSVFVIICQYFFHDKYEEEKNSKEIC